MDGFWMLPALLIGIYFAVKLTRWINYYTYGRNMETRKEISEKQGADIKQNHDDARQNR